ncbi:hypothetical protein GCM10023170_032400 [Phytohabitans houttuyneae]
MRDPFERGALTPDARVDHEPPVTVVEAHARMRVLGQSHDPTLTRWQKADVLWDIATGTVHEVAEVEAARAWRG